MVGYKKILCLANSRKLSGRCIAGKELDEANAKWIRPVSARLHEEVSEYERQYKDGTDPRVLDFIDIPLIEHRPKDHQRENWLLDPDKYWNYNGRARWGDVVRLIDPVGPLWINNISTYQGRNDRIDTVRAQSLRSSLRLLKVSSLTLHVFAPGEAFRNSKRRVQARFRHASDDYWLWVTDPDYERNFLAKDDGLYPLGECVVTVSIGEPAGDGYCYKLVAAIIEREKVGF